MISPEQTRRVDSETTRQTSVVGNWAAMCNACEKSASPSNTAASGPNSLAAVFRFRRKSARSMMSSCTRVARCTISTTPAARTRSPDTTPSPCQPLRNTNVGRRRLPEVSRQYDAMGRISASKCSTCARMNSSRAFIWGATRWNRPPRSRAGCGETGEVDALDIARRLGVASEMANKYCGASRARRFPWNRRRWADRVTGDDRRRQPCSHAFRQWIHARHSCPASRPDPKKNWAYLPSNTPRNLCVTEPAISWPAPDSRRDPCPWGRGAGADPRGSCRPPPRRADQRPLPATRRRR